MAKNVEVANQLAVPNKLSSAAQAVQDEESIKTQLFVTAGGNIGIGTSNPQQPLQVGQYLAGNSSVGMIRIAHTKVDSSGSPVAYKSWDLGVSDPNVSAPDPDAFSFYCVENKKVAIVMTSSGNVGIKNEKPAAALDVNGTVIATGLVITGLQPASTAPPDANLKAVFVDTKTGIFYHQ